MVILFPDISTIPNIHIRNTSQLLYNLYQLLESQSMFYVYSSQFFLFNYVNNYIYI